MCDVVLIKKAVPPRIMWQKVWIMDYIKERDEKIQGVKLVTINSKSENVEFSRALQLIISLEIIKSKINDIIVDDTNTDKNRNTDQCQNTTDEIKNTDDVIIRNDSSVIKRWRVAGINAHKIRKLLVTLVVIWQKCKM